MNQKDSKIHCSKISIGIPLEVLKAQADNGNALSFPKVPCHSQAVERAIKLVTKVSSKFRSYQRRHQEILAKLFHRKVKAKGYPAPKKKKKRPLPY